MKGHEKAAVDLARVFYMTFPRVEILRIPRISRSELREKKSKDYEISRSYLFYFMAQTNKQDCKMKSQNSEKFQNVNSEF